VIPSLARLEQLRRRLRMPEGADAVTQAAALDRLGRQNQGEAGSILQFVERCSLVMYASSARLERLRQDSTSTTAAYPDVLDTAFEPMPVLRG
jgi:hypothetical protein